MPQPAAFWVSVHSKDCEALLLEHLFFDMMSATDRYLLALDIFFQSLPRHPRISTTVNLSCIGATFSLGIVAPLLESIKGTGCPELSYIGNNGSPISRLIIPKNPPVADAPSWIQSFTAQSNIIFAKPVIPFTFSMLCHSPLQELVLTDMCMSDLQWTRLFRELHLPQLRTLEVDRQYPIRALVMFLQRHRLLKGLTIHTPQGQWRKSTSNTRIRIDLPSLKFLGGPLEYILVVSRHLQTPGTVRSLRVSVVDVSTGDSQLSRILACTELLPALRRVIIWFPPIFQAIPLSSLDFPRNEHRRCAAMGLSMHSSDTSETEEGSGVLVSSPIALTTAAIILKGVADTLLSLAHCLPEG